MKKHSLSFLVFIFCWIHSSNGQNIDNIRGLNWLSVDYIENMRDYLPCECMDSINYPYYISIASKKTDKEERIPEGVLNYVSETEPTPFYILSEDSTKYIISLDSENKKFELSLKTDTLFLANSIYNKKFIKSKIDFDFIKNTNAHYLDNISLLNKSLLSRGYSTIQIILKEDSLGFDCNGWLGNLNIIYSYKTQKSWVLEIKNGYLYIQEVLNLERDPLDSVKTVNIEKLQWIIQKRE